MRTTLNRRRWLAAAGAAAAATLAGCATTEAPPTLVFVHGAFQDARAWDGVLPLLRAQGLRAIAVNLPGRAGDGTPIEAATLDAYRDAVLKLVAAEPRPVVLVGHSFGGITISAVAEAAPEKVRRLVYVAAYLPEADAPDQSLAKLAERDRWNRFNKERQNFVVAKDYKTAAVLEEDRLMLFCDGCPPEAQRRTLELMQREPLAPAATPVKLSAARYGGVPKAYLHTARDRALSFEMQQQMVARTPVEKARTLPTGHSPFVEAPQALVDALLELIR